MVEVHTNSIGFGVKKEGGLFNHLFGTMVEGNCVRYQYIINPNPKLKPIRSAQPTIDKLYH